MNYLYCICFREVEKIIFGCCAMHSFNGHRLHVRIFTNKFSVLSRSPHKQYFTFRWCSNVWFTGQRLRLQQSSRTQLYMGRPKSSLNCYTRCCSANFSVVIPITAQFYGYTRVCIYTCFSVSVMIFCRNGVWQQRSALYVSSHPHLSNSQADVCAASKNFFLTLWALWGVTDSPTQILLKPYVCIQFSPESHKAQISRAHVSLLFNSNLDLQAVLPTCSSNTRFWTGICCTCIGVAVCVCVCVYIWSRYVGYVLCRGCNRATSYI